MATPSEKAAEATVADLRQRAIDEGLHPAVPLPAAYGHEHPRLVSPTEDENRHG